MKRYPMVIVRWVDSVYFGGWGGEDRVNDLCYCVSAGWLVDEDTEQVTVSVTRGYVNEDGVQDYCGGQTIPKASISELLFVHETVTNTIPPDECLDTEEYEEEGSCCLGDDLLDGECCCDDEWTNVSTEKKPTFSSKLLAWLQREEEDAE